MSHRLHTVAISDRKHNINTESFGILNPVQQYLHEIQRFPVFTHKQTLSLVRRIQEGDSAAHEELVNCNLRFTFSVATRYICTVLPLLDLVQQANLGLMAAVDKHNHQQDRKSSVQRRTLSTGGKIHTSNKAHYKKQRNLHSQHIFHHLDSIIYGIISNCSMIIKLVVSIL